MPDDKSTHIARLADQCVQCGLCLPACPTYALDRNETESPRGRIALAAALARGEAVAGDALRTPLDHCLGCLNCERVCPAHVRYDELLTTTRGLIGPRSGPARLLLAPIRHPGWWRSLRRVAHGLRLSRPARALARRLPRRSPWRAALELLPPGPVPAGTVRASATPDAEVALFPGCIGSVEDAEAQRATLALLRAAGYRVAVLPALCCGALDAHDGRAAAAARAAARVRDAWRTCGAGTLVTVTPGCLGTLREALPGVAVSDPYALLAARADTLAFAPATERVAVHLPCSQRNQAVSEATMLGLLQRIPGLALDTLQGGCCGAAGSHVLAFPDRAARLREPLLQQLAALAPTACLSSNVGCRLHLAAGLRARGAPLPTRHPLTVLAAHLLAPETP